MSGKQLFAAGSYTALGGPGIRVFAIERERLAALYDVPIDDPIWLQLSPDGRYLYAACGGEGPNEGFVAAFAPMNGDYAQGLTLLARREAHGVCPCHLCVAGGDLISANYADGSISTFPLADGVPGEMGQLIRHQGKGPHPRRQQGPHVHQVIPLGADAFQAQDLGTDRLVRYEKRQGRWEEAGAIPLPSGDGPRHVLINGQMMYLATELSSFLRMFRMEKNGLTLLQSWKLPGDAYPADNYPAALRLSPDGALLAVSCRGADGVSFFNVEPNGGLIPAGFAPSGGCWPRDIWLLNRETLLCAHQKSGDVSLLKWKNNRLNTVDALRFPAPVALAALPCKEDHHG
ncbi:MAG: lactonase family protein [Clostridia bacterium]|nr:lactonase family protein [Clostridia bacterium]